MSLFQRNTDERKSDLDSGIASNSGYLDELVEHFKNRLLSEVNLEQITSLSEADKRLKIERLVNQFMSEEKVVIPKQDKKRMLSMLIDESVGFGPLEPLLKDDSITEILVNRPSEVYVERNGRLERVNVSFKDEAHVRHIVDRVVAPLGRRIDESSPMVDARLPDGSRVNAVINPISLGGTLLSVRKFRKTPFTVDDLQEFGTFTDDMSMFMQALVETKLSLLISGGTGSGKTTILNALAKSIPLGERAITIEDSAELRLDRPNVVGMEARPPNVEGKGEITIRQLVKNSLRMRPDRIIVGEVRGPEAFDMLQAMNTGHEGSLTTVHANTPIDAINRVEGMVVMAGMDLTTNVIRDYISGALDYIVQVQRLTDGTRKIMNISEVEKSSNDKIEVRDIFRFKRTGVDHTGKVQGYFTPTGIVPKCLSHFEVHGIKIDTDLFKPKEEMNDGHNGVYSL
ncbi:CpaF family protein [Tenuibacillus multivorans]|uniref:Pilus assembly protein CpaF n=1 Tax=Tenuibacillus multivorans TaxID=237069 RepID=A0A1G9WI73_9BACI|nr:CpaF family protein [Tenuibacillus multivorans]GEL76464.1 type II secretion system protein E [Tenuibacillus multivorans]SDM83881.1 pilus assembly protein CpaF [Tenuibacillus multivorans]